MVHDPLELISLVEKFAQGRRPRVMLVGDLMVDEYIYGNAERLSPEAPVPVVQEKYRQHRAGGAGNVATDLAVLGAEVLCVAVRGTDREGELLVKLLKETVVANGGMGEVVTDGVLAFAERPTTTKTRLVGLAQHRHPQQMLRLDREEVKPISEQQEQELLAYIEKNLPSCELVCIEDYNKGLLSFSFCQRIVKLARQLKKAVLVDPAAISDYRKYHGVSTITPNRTEAEKATGKVLGDSAEAAHQLAQVLMTQLDLESCVLTLDRHGMYLLEKQSEGQVSGRAHPTRQRTVYDVTGAGDMVLAMMAMARASGASWSQAVDLANIAGGLEVERFGCVPIRNQEVVAELLTLAHQGGEKLLPLAALQIELERRRKLGHKVVFTNGCFDILHAGHVQYLQFARKQGDLLVVGINTDESVRKLKGPERPVNNQDDRMAVLAGLAAVDFVIPFGEETPKELVDAVLPDVLVKGEDYEGKIVVGRETVEGRGGKVVLAPFLKGRSTSQTIAKMATK